MSKPIVKQTRRKRRAALLYDLDFLSRQGLLRIDLTINDPNGVNTPVTPLYEARFIPAQPVNAIPRREFEPRKIITCSIVDDREVTRRVFIPYRPIDTNHKLHLCEVLDVSYVENGNYFGETVNEVLELSLVDL